MKRMCSVEGCDRPHSAKGYCLAHYTRVRRTGEPGAVDVWDKKPKPCSADGCDRLAVGLGLCGKHHLRWYRYGTVSGNDHTRENHERWLDRDHLNYEAAHDRVKRYRGAPSSHACACGKQAEDWAYLHTDPEPLVDERGRPFSDDVDRYAPMCRSCHKTFDWAIRRAAS